MWSILQQGKPDDFVIGTGKSHSVRQFLELAARYGGIEIEWRGTGVEEKGYVKSGVLVEIDARYFRPTEVEHLQADTRKARSALQWEPKVSFEDLVKVMMDYDMLAAGLTPPGEGIKAVQSKGFGWTKHQISLHQEIRE
jgi:GDPmannose 4,6-dehydratase